MSYHQFQVFEKIGTEESQIDTSIELSERVNLLIKQNTYFLSNSPNISLYSLALLYYAILNFPTAVTVPLCHIVEQYILEQKDLNKVHYSSGEHLANFLDKILMFA